MKTQGHEMTVANGREFLSIPGPTNVPDAVLQAMNRPAIDLYTGEMVGLTEGLLADLPKLFRTKGHVYIYAANGHGGWEAAATNVLSRGDQVLALEPYMKPLARIQRVELLGGGQRPTGEPSALVEGLGEIFVTLRGVVDPAEVRKRLERDLAKVEKELSGVEGKLRRPDFVEKAPPEIVEKERHRAAGLRDRHGTLQRHLAVLAQES
jgi:hypothetical protein